MASSLFSRPFFLGYSLLWKLANPLLKRSKRLADGWRERFAPKGWLLPDFPSPEGYDQGDHTVDLWIQAASGGEARLAVSLCRSLSRDVPLRILIVTWTRQGRDVVESAIPALAESHPLLRLAVRFAPFDHPDIVRRAIRQACPRLLVLLETELWPGLLAACKERGVPVRLVNGRINSSTTKVGRFFPKLMAGIAPEGIRAISEEDCRGFSSVFPSTACSVEEMPNIKFDLAAELLEKTLENTMPGIALDAPLFLFASVRKGEETRLPGQIQRIYSAQPNANVVIVPRHLHRVSAWKCALDDLGFNPCLLSQQTPGQPLPSRSVLVWDRFGDLPQLYAAASAVFVGGSFGQGGQNFLESLAAGRIPCIGPSARNFLWAMHGTATQPSLEECGLLRVGRTPQEVMDIMLELAAHPRDRHAVREQFRLWLAPRLGGSSHAASWLEEALLPQDSTQ